MAKITVQNTNITIINVYGEDYVSITDLARHKSDDPTAVIGNWMRNRNTIEFLGIWESLYNPDFKPLEFEGFRKEAGLNAFTLSPKKWIETTNAIGMTAKQWREANPESKGNIRDYASVNELICLSNMESINAVFIEQGLSQPERLIKLNQIAIHQMSVLENDGMDRQLLKGM